MGGCDGLDWFFRSHDWLWGGDHDGLGLGLTGSWVMKKDHDGVSDCGSDDCFCIKVKFFTGGTWCFSRSVVRDHGPVTGCSCSVWFPVHKNRCCRSRGSSVQQNCSGSFTLINRFLPAQVRLLHEVKCGWLTREKQSFPTSFNPFSALRQNKSFWICGKLKWEAAAGPTRVLGFRLNGADNVGCLRAAGHVGHKEGFMEQNLRPASTQKRKWSSLESWFWIWPS